MKKSKYIKDINPHIKDPKVREEAVFQSIYTSSKLEGIDLTVQEARAIYQKVLDEKKIKKDIQ